MYDFLSSNQESVSHKFFVQYIMEYNLKLNYLITIKIQIWRNCHMKMNIHYHKSILKFLPYTANVYKQTTLYIQPYTTKIGKSMPCKGLQCSFYFKKCLHCKCLQGFTGTLRGNWSCRDFKFTGIACIPAIPVIFEVNQKKSVDFFIYTLLRFFKFPYNFCGDFRRTCNPCDNYMHFTGYVLRHWDPRHF